MLHLFSPVAEKHPQLSDELSLLLTSTLMFLAMTAICAASFISSGKSIRRWWWIPQAGMWGGLGLIVLYYHP
jgi:hypothetical protein